MKLIVDGNGFAFRALHTKIDPMINAKGQDVTAIYLMMQMLVYLLRNEDETTEIVFSWDVGKSRAKTEMADDYKATREMTEQKLSIIRQINIMQKELFPYLGIKQVSLEGVEADDIIAILSRALAANKKEPEEVLVVSADKDLLQLVRPKIHVFNPIKRKRYTSDNFDKLVGMPVDGFVDYLCLIGDEVDNIGGIEGIGEGTAKWAVRKYRTIENMYMSEQELRLVSITKCPEKANAKRLMSIFTSENREKLKRNKELITLGKLLTPEEKRQIITDYVCNQTKVDGDTVLGFFRQYQLLELQRQHEDLMYVFSSVSPKRKKSLYVF